MKVITRVETVSKSSISKAVYHNLRIKNLPHTSSDKLIKVIHSNISDFEIDGKIYKPIIDSIDNFIEYLHTLWDYVQLTRVKKGLKPFRRNTNPYIEFIIAFDKNSRDFVNDPKNWPALDKRAYKFIKMLEEKFGIKAVLGVRHSDETTTHYHILFLNYSWDKQKTFTKLFKSKREFAQLQDLVTECFEDLGFQRGEKYDPSKHKYKQIHKSVWQLHKELPKEIEAKRRELERLEKKISELQDQLKTLSKVEQEKKKQLRELMEKHQYLSSDYKRLVEILLRVKRQLETFGLTIDRNGNIIRLSDGPSNEL